MLKLCAAALAAACLVTPAFADAPVPAPGACNSQAASALLDVAKKAGVTVNADFKVNGDFADRIIIVTDTSEVWLFAFKNDCLVATIPLEKVAGASIPNPAPKAPLAPAVSL